MQDYTFNFTLNLINKMKNSWEAKLAEFEDRVDVVLTPLYEDIEDKADLITEINQYISSSELDVLIENQFKLLVFSLLDVN